MAWKVAKNILYVLLLIALGALVWHYVTPHLFEEEKTPAEVAMELNDAFVEGATKDLDNNIADANLKIAEKVTGDVEKLFDQQEQQKGLAAWNVGDSPVEAPPSRPQSNSFYHRMLHAVQGFFHAIFGD